MARERAGQSQWSHGLPDHVQSGHCRGSAVSVLLAGPLFSSRVRFCQHICCAFPLCEPRFGVRREPRDQPHPSARVTRLSPLPGNSHTTTCIRPAACGRGLSPASVPSKGSDYGGTSFPLPPPGSPPGFASPRGGRSMGVNSWRFKVGRFFFGVGGRAPKGSVTLGDTPPPSPGCFRRPGQHPCRKVWKTPPTAG